MREHGKLEVHSLLLLLSACLPSNSLTRILFSAFPFLSFPLPARPTPQVE